MEAQRSVLVAPLNWGLGHATRCIPLIGDYLEKGWQVHIASDGDALLFLKKEFPELGLHELPGYDIRYSKNSETMLATMISQLPKLSARISREKKWLDRFLQKNPLDLIISDNRYGLYHESVKSVMLCHQLNFRLPLMSSLVTRMHTRYLIRFNECWVPDTEDRALSGTMSVGDLGIPVRFIGPLSRFKRTECKKYKTPVLAILSGPEPQRSLLEKGLIPILSSIPGAVLIRGLMKDGSSSTNGEFKVIGNLGSRELEEQMSCTELVICRSGYSSIMDLVAMDVKAILVPTPGQPEQEYLAEHLKDHPLFSIIAQSEISDGLEEMILSKSTILQS